MDSARITTLLEPFVPPASLCAEQVEALSKYLSLLQRWNARTNLTAIRDEGNIVLRHFGESLFAASRLLRAGAEGKGGALSANIPEEQRCNAAELSSVLRTEEETLSVIDIGSGAGFPGVPLKIYSPQISLTLIESQNKKATFLKEVIRALSLSDAKVFVGRAETYTGRADLVTFRAVEHFERVLPIAASLLKPTKFFSAGAESAVPNLGYPTIAPSPRLALLIGATQQEVAERVLPNFDWQRPMPLPVSSGRILLVGSPKQ
ncbi:MAG TPA: 16S rRNA (guanine(527)-N(7))-methyltransferase RsmG [Terriglobales bacterium]|nr:16S rRNA (guanine(527)-N(7))-methyltransferase RsmG [Terriglobales bacterium]